MKPTAQGKPPQGNPMPSTGPETGGEINPTWMPVATPPIFDKIIDIGGRGIGEEFDQTPPQTAWRPGLQNVPIEGAKPDLAYMRLIYPFMPIMPFPDDVVSVVLVNASTAVDINLPDGTTLVNFDSDGSDWWISNFGRAAVPVTTGQGVSGGDTNNLQLATPMVHPPNNVFWYTGSLRQISVISTTPNRIVQVRCWITKIRPTHHVQPS